MFKLLTTHFAEVVNIASKYLINCIMQCTCSGWGETELVGFSPTMNIQPFVIKPKYRQRKTFLVIKLPGVNQQYSEKQALPRNSIFIWMFSVLFNSNEIGFKIMYLWKIYGLFTSFNRVTYSAIDVQCAAMLYFYCVCAVWEEGSGQALNLLSGSVVKH